MIKTISTIILISAFMSAQSQTKDSVVTGLQNANDVYYSFNNGIVKTEPNKNWDIAFETSGITASIMANHIHGILVWQSPYSSSQWASFDTATYTSWNKMYNNNRGWSFGAFNRHAFNNNNPFDLGWGIYDPGNNHTVTGDSIFLIKLANGNFKKIMILSHTTGNYIMKYSDVDGSNEKVKTMDLVNFKDKNFIYYSFDAEAVIDREPATAQWDLVFTKYTEFIPTAYNVGGIWSNKGVRTAEARNTPVNSINYGSFNFSDTSSIIGYDWKTYNQPLNRYDMTSNLVYFVKNNSGQIFKIVFTGYKGGNSGTYYFNKQELTAGISNPDDEELSVFPNPTSGSLFLSVGQDDNLVSYGITDLSGKTVLSGEGREINTSELAEGIYYLQAQTELGTRYIKFIKANK